MDFDPNNRIVQLCTQGMEKEGFGEMDGARKLFLEAWELAETDLEKFTAAHYLARQQDSILGKLEWDKIALEFAKKVRQEGIEATLPSLHLNIAKGYEDLGNLSEARRHYESAEFFSNFLPNNGYGQLIAGGIRNGLERLRHHNQNKSS